MKTIELYHKIIELIQYTQPIGSMYGRLMLTKLGYIDDKCYHIWHTWILWAIGKHR